MYAFSRGDSRKDWYVQPVKLSKATGIPQPTLWRMARYPEYGANYQTVKKISDYLEGNK